ncbi:MAG: anthranilate phosphoribosyltransferase [Chloroflexota bacterium]
MDMDAFIPFVKAVGRGEKLKRDLTYGESVDALRLILQRRATDAQIGAFLIAQRVKGEAVDEVRGFTDVVRNEFMTPVRARVEGLVDLAVPYDGKAKTAQLAPAIAILLAEAGIPVLLHGDVGVPTKEGVGPGLVLAALGVPTIFAPADVGKMIERAGVGYVGAAHYIPAWHNLLPIRRQFGLRTLLNTVEKLFNPGNAPYQVSGFFHANYIDRIRITQTGTRQSWIVQGEEGSIEMASGRRTHIFAVESHDDLILEPADVGLVERERVEVDADPEKHAAINAAVLSGETGPALTQVLYTTATLLHILGVAEQIEAGMTTVYRLIESGRAMQRLEKLRT